MNHFGLYAKTHENNWHMGIVTPGRSMHGDDRPFVEQEPIGLLDDVNITGTGNVVIVADLIYQRI